MLGAHRGTVAGSAASGGTGGNRAGNGRTMGRGGNARTVYSACRRSISPFCSPMRLRTCAARSRTASSPSERRHPYSEAMAASTMSRSVRSASARTPREPDSVRLMRIVCLWQAYLSGDDIPGVESDIYVQQLSEASNQQARAHQQHHRECKFCHDQSAPDAVVPKCGASSFPPFCKAISQFQARQPEGWHRAENDPGQKRENKGETYDDGVDSYFF